MKNFLPDPDCFRTTYEIIDDCKYPTWQIKLPLGFSDRDNFEIYLQKRGDKFYVFDDGSALWYATGLGVKSAVFAEKLHRIALVNGITLDRYGDLSKTCSPEDLTEVIGDFIKTLCCSEYLLSTEQDLYLEKISVFEVVKDEFSKLTSKVICKPGKKFIGYSKNSYSFDFKIDKLFVDAISPSGNSVNSCIAKVIDIRAALSDHDQRNFFPTAVIDDREEGANISSYIRKVKTIMPTYRLSEAPRLLENSNFS